MLDDRNLTSHAYDETLALRISGSRPQTGYQDRSRAKGVRAAQPDALTAESAAHQVVEGHS